jgi:hypothetical protein
VSLFGHFLFGCRGRCLEFKTLDLVLFGCTRGAGGNFLHDFHALSASILDGIVTVAEISATTTSLFTLATGVSLLADFDDYVVARGFRRGDLLAKVASKHIPVLVWFVGGRFLVEPGVQSIPSRVDSVLRGGKAGVPSRYYLAVDSRAIRP